MRITALCFTILLVALTSFGQNPAQAPPPTAAQPAASAAPATKPRLFLQAQSRGPNLNAGKDQTVEMSNDFGEDCPGIVISTNQDNTDYTVSLDHYEAGLFVRDNQFQLANKNGDQLANFKAVGGIRGGAKRVCDLVLADWATGGSKRQAADANPGAPASDAAQDSNADQAADQPAVQIAFTSIPAGADIEIDGSFVGNTPSTIDTAPGDHVVVISKRGYKDWQRKVKVSGGTINLRAELEHTK